MSAPDFQCATIVSLPFAENTYVAHRAGRSDCLVVDPGLEPQKIIDHLEAEQLEPAAILLTHGHADHIAGNAALKERWPDCPLVIGRGDAPKLTDAELNLSAGFGLEILSPPADVLLDEGDTYCAAGFDLEVREIPGHSIGHVVFIWRDPAASLPASEGATSVASAPAVVFGGDVLFAGSVGRTDFPDGSFEQLADGIHRKLFILPDETLVLPGHGPHTTIGREKRSNPFVGRPAGYAVEF